MTTVRSYSVIGSLCLVALWWHCCFWLIVLDHSRMVHSFPTLANQNNNNSIGHPYLFVDDPTDSEPDETDDLNDSDYYNFENPDLRNRTSGSNQTPPTTITNSTNKTYRKFALGVVNGHDATKGQWTFMAKLFVTFADSLDRFFQCGGTLVNEETVLTAAHCLIGGPIDSIEIVLAGNERDYSSEFKVMGNTQPIFHCDFDVSTGQNDIALVRLLKPVPEQYQTFVNLPTRDNPNIAHHRCMALGWGSLSNELSEYTEDLQIVNLPWHRNRDCYKAIRVVKFNPEIMLCAGYLTGGKDACVGDSGGPLMCPLNDDSTTWIQMGIISLGEGCAQPNRLGIYTRVSKFTFWIESKLGMGPGAYDEIDHSLDNDY